MTQQFHSQVKWNPMFKQMLLREYSYQRFQPQLETTQIPRNKRMDKHTTVYSYSEILFRNKKHELLIDQQHSWISNILYLVMKGVMKKNTHSMIPFL